jgi:hypothetical protein
LKGVRLQMSHVQIGILGMPWEEYYAVFNAQTHKTTSFYTMN